MLKRLIDEFKKKEYVIAVVIFGSYTKERQTPLSDIDICVIDDENYDYSKRMEVYGYGSKKVNVSLFSDLPLYIKYEVLKGKVLIMNDEKKFKKLKERTIREYLEQKWIWDEYFRIRKEKGRWSIG